MHDGSRVVYIQRYRDMEKGKIGGIKKGMVEGIVGLLRDY